MAKLTAEDLRAFSALGGAALASKSPLEPPCNGPQGPFIKTAPAALAGDDAGACCFG
jgi:hypothetical protein